MRETSHVTGASRVLSLPQPDATMGLVSYYTYGLPTFTVIVIALYLLFTGVPRPSLKLVVGLLRFNVQVPVKPLTSADS